MEPPRAPKFEADIVNPSDDLREFLDYHVKKNPDHPIFLKGFIVSRDEKRKKVIYGFTIHEATQ